MIMCFIGVRSVAYAGSSCAMGIGWGEVAILGLICVLPVAIGIVALVVVVVLMAAKKKDPNSE